MGSRFCVLIEENGLFQDVSILLTHTKKNGNRGTVGQRLELSSKSKPLDINFLNEAGHLGKKKKGNH